MMAELTREKIAGLKDICGGWLKTLDEEHAGEADIYIGILKALDMAEECLRLREENEQLRRDLSETRAELVSAYDACAEIYG